MATIVGRTIASMMAIESIRMVLSAAAMGPCGSKIFIGTAIPISHTPEPKRAAVRAVPKTSAGHANGDGGAKRGQIGECGRKPCGVRPAICNFACRYQDRRRIAGLLPCRWRCYRAPNKKEETRCRDPRMMPAFGPAPWCAHLVERVG